MKRIKFAKLSGTGNDFVTIDNRKNAVTLRADFARKVCDRKRSIGADGVLFIEKPALKNCDLKMRIFNADGSEAEMCGNGIRCAAFFSFKIGVCKVKAAIETLAGVKYVEVKAKKSRVNVNMGLPSGTRLDFPLKTAAGTYKASFVNTGVPHAVVFDNKPDVKKTGREIRYHSDFGAKGTNANFVSVSGKHSISVRTYERGVEDETDACGTGSTASAYIAYTLGKAEMPIKVLTHGGELLTISLDADGNLYMDGGVKYICDGIVYI